MFDQLFFIKKNGLIICLIRTMSTFWEPYVFFLFNNWAFYTCVFELYKTKLLK